MRALWLTLILCLYCGKCLRAQSFITGYAGNWSNLAGQPADFYLSAVTEDPDGTLTIYDVLSNPVADIQVPLKKQTFAPDNLEPWKNGYGWEPTTFEMPDLPSGLYYMNGPRVGSDYVPFLITEPEKQADIVVIYPTNTVNAYSKSVNFNPNFLSQVNLYSVGRDGKNPPLVSFQRPQNEKVWVTAGFDRWLLRQQEHSFKYVSDADLEDYSAIAGAKMVVIPGHSEYWTTQARRNFDRFVEFGGSALVISGNTMYRAVEYDDPSSPTELRFSPRASFVHPRLGYQTWESIGADFAHGGFGSAFNQGRAREFIQNPHDGWKMLDVSPSYFEGTGLKVGDVIYNPSQEYDGVPFTSLDPINGPTIDYELLNFHRIDLIAFENAILTGEPKVGTWIDFQKTEDSGRVINVATLNWARYHGKDKAVQELVTANMVELLLKVQADFDDDELLSTRDIDLLTAEIRKDTPRTRFDLTEDGLVTRADLNRWLADYAETWYGDANLDGVVKFDDFMALRSGFGLPSTWSGGDFNGNGETTMSDFLILAENFGRDFRAEFSSSPNAAVAVPEPQSTCLWCSILFAAGWLRRRQRRHA